MAGVEEEVVLAGGRPEAMGRTRLPLGEEAHRSRCVFLAAALGVGSTRQGKVTWERCGRDPGGSSGATGARC